MGNEAEEIVQEDGNVIEGEAITVEETEVVDSDLDDGSSIDEENNEEVEIVREGTQPQFNQQQVNDIVNKRVKRLNGKATTQSNVELQVANERNKILELALEQAKGNKATELKLPDPSEFDEGIHDPEYVKQNSEYTKAIIAKQVADQVAQATANVSTTHDQEQQSAALLSKQVKHYERAEEIGAKDYEATEDKALEVLGNDTANHIIDNFDDSHVILYFLGKNPKEAERIANLLKTKPIKGVAEVGRLSAELRLKPKNKTVADPDEEIKGDGHTQDSAVERKLSKLRDDAAKTGKMKALMDFKRKHKL